MQIKDYKDILFRFRYHSLGRQEFTDIVIDEVTMDITIQDLVLHALSLDEFRKKVNNKLKYKLTPENNINRVNIEYPFSSFTEYIVLMDKTLSKTIRIQFLIDQEDFILKIPIRKIVSSIGYGFPVESYNNGEVIVQNLDGCVILA